MDLDAGTPVHQLASRSGRWSRSRRRSEGTASVLVMDEPTSALTSREVDNLFRLIEQLSERGVAVVYITHRLDEVYRIGHRVTVLRDGRLVKTALLSEVTVGELVRFMANRDLDDHFPKRRQAPGRELLRGRRSRPPRRAARHQLHAAAQAKWSASPACLAPGAASWRACWPAPIDATPDRSRATAARFSCARRPMRFAMASACCRRIARPKAWLRI